MLGPGAGHERLRSHRLLAYSGTGPQVRCHAAAPLLLNLSLTTPPPLRTQPRFYFECMTAFLLPLTGWLNSIVYGFVERPSPLLFLLGSLSERSAPLTLNCCCVLSGCDAHTTGGARNCTSSCSRICDPCSVRAADDPGCEQRSDGTSKPSQVPQDQKTLYSSATSNSSPPPNLFIIFVLFNVKLTYLFPEAYHHSSCCVCVCVLLTPDEVIR